MSQYHMLMFFHKSLLMLTKELNRVGFPERNKFYIIALQSNAILFMPCFSVSLFRGMQQCLRRWMLTIHFLKAFSNTPLNTKSNFLATFLFSLVTCFSKTQYSSFVLFLRFLMVKHFTIFFMSQRLYFSLLFVSQMKMLSKTYKAKYLM